jgi:hypothetical protein
MFRNAVKAAAVAAFWGGMTGPAAADAERLFEAVGMPRIIEIMREEGLAYGETIRTDLLNGQGGQSWTDTVSAIYDADAMRAEMFDGFEARLDGVDVEPLLEFFESERGQRIVEGEIAVRRAFLDEAVEDAAKEALADLRADNPDRYALLETFVDANDLVESNVMGAMNSNYAFYTGLMAGQAFDETLTEQQILSDVWSQEDSIRADTEEWVYSYLGLAYDALSETDLEAYVALSRTDAGRSLNRALFGAFGAVFDDISFRLGESAARFLVGQDI